MAAVIDGMMSKLHPYYMDHIGQLKLHHIIYSTKYIQMGDSLRALTKKMKLPV